MSADRRTVRRALLSVYDKTGLVDFARALHAEFGVELISTGGTATALKGAGLPVTLVEEITGFPELLDGRVKTLHPRIHAAILADRDNPDHMRQLAEHGIEPIDMVVVNLYPFEETIRQPDATFEQAIEMIDIGGPCLLRAAAKNHRHVLVVSDPEQYDLALSAMRRESESDDERADNAFSAFWTTADYDAEISRWLGGADDDGLPVFDTVRLFSWGTLRYGENPHQQAKLLQSYDGLVDGPLAVAADNDEQAAMSYNNFLDASAALGVCGDLSRARPSLKHAVFVKHMNACGAGVAEDPIEAYRRAYIGDPNAAMGGVLALDHEVDAEIAKTVMETLAKFGKPLADGGHPQPPQAFFVDVWLAPSFTDDAVEVIRTLKPWGQRVRLLGCDELADAPADYARELRTIAGGVLSQTPDDVGLNESDWQVVTQRGPTERELEDLRLAWLVCKHTKSNAISICHSGMLLGNGAGQMSRVMSCRIATWLARENGHEEMLENAAAASDAFFPFADGPHLLAEAGISAIIQPGGSKRDAEVIAACNERDIAMVFTGVRHFRH